MTPDYDYIITGAGCAGLSLLMRMIEQPFFQQKKILVVDDQPEKSKERSWCFWETAPGFFEPLVRHRWKQIDFYGLDFSARYDLKPYEYKMIRWSALNEYVRNKAAQKPNVQFYHDSVIAIHTGEAQATVATKGKSFTCSYVFNSIFFDYPSYTELPAKTGYYHLLQHFKGWHIKTESPFFDNSTATFMDFRVSQEHGTCFGYVLPETPTEALVEYTVFSKSLLTESAYETALKDYIRRFLKLENYTVQGEEFGAIPMTNYPFSKGHGRVINLGTAGGYTKASSGYTFQFIQKHTGALVTALMQGEDPLKPAPWASRRFPLYDATLLHLLYHDTLSGASVFGTLFKKNPTARILKFLDNETTAAEELSIMQTVPSLQFVKASFAALLGLP